MNVKDCDFSVYTDEELLKKFYSRYGGFWIYPDLLDFCYLVNPYFMRSGIVDEMEAKFRTLISEYPAGMRVNSQLASKCWQVKQEYIVVGNGAAELIKVLMETTTGKVGIVRPTFEEYPNRLSAEQVVAFVPQDESFRYAAADLMAYFSLHRVEMLLLINPDNPSGNFIKKEEVCQLAAWCEEKKIRFVLDESFVDFSVDYQHNSFVHDELLEKYPHMCVVKSISKSYGVPGIRLGFACSADISLISGIKQRVSIWNINSFAEYFMEILPRYRDDYELACARFIHTRANFESALRTIPFIRVMPSQANYFFLEVLPPFTSQQLCAMLLRHHHILASACLAKKGIAPNRYMRIAVRCHDDNEKLVAALSAIAESNR